jgi:hypothetical protein
MPVTLVVLSLLQPFIIVSSTWAVKQDITSLTSIPDVAEAWQLHGKTLDLAGIELTRHRQAVRNHAHTLTEALQGPGTSSTADCKNTLQLHPHLLSDSD